MTSQKPSDKQLSKATVLLATCIVAPLAVSLFTACDNGCEQTRENYPRISFVSTSGRQLRSVAITMQSGDTLVTNKAQTSYNDIEIDINPRRNETFLLIQSSYTDYGDSFTELDTVRLGYETDARFLDLACGCTVMYNITEVTSTYNLIKRVIVNEPQVYTDSGINITFEY